MTGTYGELIPSRREVLSVIPQECFDRNLRTSCQYLALSVALTVGTGLFAYVLIPMQWTWVLVWILYGIVNGTIATGCWVIAHECGHRAFARSAVLQDCIGYLLHSALLVPYFSWQRSHALHHARPNHLDLGETFVPPRANSKRGRWYRRWHDRLGTNAFGILVLTMRFTLGWPVYLLTGATGPPNRKWISHFWPVWPCTNSLFPGKWRNRAWLSDLGILATISILTLWVFRERSMAPVIAVYLGPYS